MEGAARSTSEGEEKALERDEEKTQERLRRKQVPGDKDPAGRAEALHEVLESLGVGGPNLMPELDLDWNDFAVDPLGNEVDFANWRASPLALWLSEEVHLQVVIADHRLNERLHERSQNGGIRLHERRGTSQDRIPDTEIR